MNSPKRDEILKAALRLFSQHGFHGTSMAKIAAEANSGAGTIYNYFAGKDELIRELYTQIKREFAEKSLLGTRAEMALQERFYVIWRNVIRYYIEYPERITFTQQFYASPYFNQECLEFVNSTLAPMISPFQEAMTAGLIKTLPLPVLEALTLDVATSLARRHTQGEIFLDEEMIARCAEACWAAIKSDGSQNEASRTI